MRDALKVVAAIVRKHVSVQLIRCSGGTWLLLDRGRVRGTWDSSETEECLRAFVDCAHDLLQMPPASTAVNASPDVISPILASDGPSLDAQAPASWPLMLIQHQHQVLMDHLLN